MHFFPINILWQPRIPVLTGSRPSRRRSPRASERLAGPSEVEEFAGQIHIPRDSRTVCFQLGNDMLYRVSVDGKHISATSRRRQVDELLLVMLLDPRRFIFLAVSPRVPVPAKPYDGGWQVRLRTQRQGELLQHWYSSWI